MKYLVLLVSALFIGAVAAKKHTESEAAAEVVPCAERKNCRECLADGACVTTLNEGCVTPEEARLFVEDSLEFGYHECAWKLPHDKPGKKPEGKARKLKEHAEKEGKHGDADEVLVSDVTEEKPEKEEKNSRHTTITAHDVCSVPCVHSSHKYPSADDVADAETVALYHEEVAYSSDYYWLNTFWDSFAEEHNGEELTKEEFEASVQELEDQGFEIHDPSSPVALSETGVGYRDLFFFVGKMESESIMDMYLDFAEGYEVYSDYEEGDWEEWWYDWEDWDDWDDLDDLFEDLDDWDGDYEDGAEFEDRRRMFDDDVWDIDMEDIDDEEDFDDFDFDFDDFDFDFEDFDWSWFDEFDPWYDSNDYESWDGSFSALEAPVIGAFYYAEMEHKVGKHGATKSQYVGGQLLIAFEGFFEYAHKEKGDVFGASSTAGKLHTIDTMHVVDTSGRRQNGDIDEYLLHLAATTTNGATFELECRFEGNQTRGSAHPVKVSGFEVDNFGLKCDIILADIEYSDACKKHHGCGVVLKTFIVSESQIGDVENAENDIYEYNFGATSFDYKKEALTTRSGADEGKGPKEGKGKGRAVQVTPYVADCGAVSDNKALAEETAAAGRIEHDGFEAINCVYFSFNGKNEKYVNWDPEVKVDPEAAESSFDSAIGSFLNDDTANFDGDDTNAEGDHFKSGASTLSPMVALLSVLALLFL